MADAQQQDVKLTYTTPTVVSDGNIIMINEDTNVPTLMFFQVREQHEGHLHGDVVASVRFNNIADLQNLSDSINSVVKKHLNREP